MCSHCPQRFLLRLERSVKASRALACRFACVRVWKDASLGGSIVLRVLDLLARCYSIGIGAWERFCPDRALNISVRFRAQPRGRLALWILKGSGQAASAIFIPRHPRRFAVSGIRTMRLGDGSGMGGEQTKIPTQTTSSQKQASASGRPQQQRRRLPMLAWRT